MKVLVFEPIFGGHRLHFVAGLLQGLVETGVEVTVAIEREAPASAEYRVHLAGWANRVRIDPWMPSPAGGAAGGARASFDLLRQSIERTRPDHLYIPSADGVAQVVGVMHQVRRRILPPHLHSEILLLRGSFAYPPAGRGGWVKSMKDRLSFMAALAAPWTAAYHLDPIVWDRFRQRGGSGARGLRLMPDPVEAPSGADRAAVLSDLGVPADGRYIGTAGLLSERKGVDRLIHAYAAARRAGELRGDDRLLLIGKQEPPIRALLTGQYRSLLASGHIQGVDRVLETQAFADAISAMDVVAVPYPRHIGSASIVIRAAAAARPVLGGEFGWTGSTVNRFRLGRTIDPLDSAAFAAALPQIINEAPAFRLTDAAKRFVQYHTLPNFAATWTQDIRRRLNLPPSPDLRDWQWVLDGAADR